MTCDNRTYKTDQVSKSARHSNQPMTTIRATFVGELREAPLGLSLKTGITMLDRTCWRNIARDHVALRV